MSLLFSAGVFLIFFGAAVRPTSDEGISVVLPEVFLLFSGYGDAFVVLGIFFLWCAARKNKAEIGKIDILYLLFAFLSYRFLIILLELRSDLWIKYFQSFILMAATTFLVLKMKSQPKSFDICRWPCCGLLIWAIFSLATGVYFVIFNGEYGVHAGRFYGFFSHPNFAAISYAVCGVYFFVIIENYAIKMTEKIIFSLLFLANIYIMIGTGSRTGFVAFAGGLCVVLFHKVNSGKSKDVIYVLLFAVFVYFAVNIFGGDGFESGLSRIISGDNTRIDVWSYMYSSFLSSPLYGVGLMNVDTAGSYIRGFGAGGMLLGLSLLLFAAAFFYSMYFNILHGNNILYYSLIATIIFAGVFEGILLEALGFSLFILSVSIASLE